MIKKPSISSLLARVATNLAAIAAVSAIFGLKAYEIERENAPGAQASVETAFTARETAWRE